jgi:hypothetical protein
MRYDEFRDRLQTALQNVGLLGERLGNPVETIDLESMGRRWKVYLFESSTDTKPFQVTAKIAFTWDPFNTARSYTCEEDLLTELLGRAKSSSKTEPRFTRVDLELLARLPYGSTATIPEALTFGSWADSAKQKLDKAFTEGKSHRQLAIPGAVQEIKIESKCDPAGCFSISGISTAVFRLVRVPRIWDDPERRDAEKSPARELASLAKRFKCSMDEWRISISELARWIRYTPPAADAIQSEPRLEQEEDGADEEGGPETIH